MIPYLPPVHNSVLCESNRQPPDFAWSREFTPNGGMTSVAITVPHYFGMGNDFAEAGSLAANYYRDDNAKPLVKYFPQRAPVGSH